MLSGTYNGWCNKVAGQLVDWDYARNSSWITQQDNAAMTLERREWELFSNLVADFVK